MNETQLIQAGYYDEPADIDLYLEWIRINVKNPYGKCKFYSDEMLKVFPELIKVRGHYYCSIWGKLGHWWLKTKDNIIIDPTARQFPTNGFCEYEEWIEGSEEPTGKCLHCGEYAYDYSTFCSDKCSELAAKYYDMELRQCDQI